MKTLKKTLSLTLVFALVFSLMSMAFAAETTTTSTTTTGYKDAADITYKEAVDVTSAIGVFQGNDLGAFAPKDNLTREQAAKIICYLSMGQAAADKLSTSSAPFADVAADRWSAGSVAYCKQQGIIAGYGDGKFGPTDTVTGYQFAKMLLVALGYDATIEQFNGSDWSVNVAKRAFQNKLFTGNNAFVGTAPAIREEAALYVLNTLQAGLVTYETKGTEIKLPDGTTIRQGASAPKQETGSFMKSNYPTLKVENGTDAFGRNANTWTLRGVEIGTYANAGSIVITEEQTTKDIEKLLKGYSFNSTPNEKDPTDVTPKENGKDLSPITKGAIDSLKATTIAGFTGNGVKVEIFVDKDNAKLITGISIVKTVFAQVKNVNTNSKTVTLVVASAGGVRPYGSTLTVKGADNETIYEALKGLPVDTPVLVTPITADDTNYSVDSVAMPTVVTGKVSATSIDSGAVVKMTVNGTSYDVSDAQSGAVRSATVDTKKDATILLDAYGYVVHYKGATATVAGAYVLDKYQTLENSRIVNMAKIVLSDGTITDVAIDSNSSVAAADLETGKYYKVEAGTAYKFNTASDGTDTMAVGGAILASEKQLAGSPARYYASDVKFIFVNPTNKTATVKEGVQNVPVLDTVNSIAALGRASLADPTLVVKAVYVVNGVAADVTSIVYFADNATNGWATVKAADGTDVALKTYDGYINGELVEKMPITNPPVSPAIAKNDFFICTKNANGSYTLGATKYEANGNTVAASVSKGAQTISGTVLNRYIALTDPSVTVDLANAVFVDTRSNVTKIDSLYAFATQVAATPVVVDVLYNGTNNNAAVVYIRSVDTGYALSFASDAKNGMTPAVTVDGGTVTTGDKILGGTTVTMTLTGSATAAKTMQVKVGETVIGSVDVAQNATTATITFKMPSADTSITLGEKA